MGLLTPCCIIHALLRTTHTHYTRTQVQHQPSPVISTSKSLRQPRLSFKSDASPEVPPPPQDGTRVAGTILMPVGQTLIHGHDLQKGVTLTSSWSIGSHHIHPTLGCRADRRGYSDGERQSATSKACLNPEQLCASLAANLTLAKPTTFSQAPFVPRSLEARVAIVTPERQAE
ncbi:hypothetical protein Bbelb_411570 [Branchiostoma belcheri]|nr:hypothetical protein Bbelb_437060 [Branchiostoma belcheri]KAI8481078.1 hypothetical protein Bbelb_411570 [Branchiostoma belcheri]